MAASGGGARAMAWRPAQGGAERPVGLPLRIGFQQDRGPCAAPADRSGSVATAAGSAGALGRAVPERGVCGREVPGGLLRETSLDLQCWAQRQRKADAPNVRPGGVLHRGHDLRLVAVRVKVATNMGDAAMVSTMMPPTTSATIRTRWPRRRVVGRAIGEQLLPAAPGVPPPRRGWGRLAGGRVEASVRKVSRICGGRSA